MEFTDFSDLISKVNAGLGRFCNEFQYKRKELTGSGRTAGNNELFGNIKKDDGWAINKGGGTEVQYHIAFNTDDNIIRYGLGFNTQYVPFASNTISPQDLMRPFMNAFLQKEAEIRVKLPGYSFIYGDRGQLINPAYDQYTLFGKEMAVEEKDDVYYVRDADFDSLLEDLKKLFPIYVEIFETRNTILKMEKQLTPMVDLLKYKKQIILQGPPGTGKTKLAKELASKMVGLPIEKGKNDIEDNDIVENLKVGDKIPTVAGNATYDILKVGRESRIITLRKSTEKEDNSDFETIKRFYKDKLWQNGIDDNDARRAAAISHYIYNQINKAKSLEQSDQFKLIQFHPSYSYEDFVRGIVAKPNEEGTGILYNAENKIFATIADLANQNYLESQRETEKSPSSKFSQQLEKFVDEVRESIDKDGEFVLGDDTTAKIIGIGDGAFIYSFEKRPEIRYRLLFSDLIKIENYPKKVLRTIDIRDMQSGYLKMQGKHPYYFKVFNLIKAVKIDNSEISKKAIELKNYVLIIDEINRANLSSVLGELIYALEYRGEKVESVYGIDGNNELILPPNLYIIGTMNTADRSVGHIDYAIRRRFAFVDVLPEVLPDNFETALFKKVSSLFVKDISAAKLESSQYLSSEFRPQDVCIGHSYFIKKENVDSSMRLKYEILPILEEYIKDGVLKESKELREILDNLESEIS